MFKWLRDFFAAPRRLRELTEAHGVLSENHKALKVRYESMAELRDKLSRCQERMEKHKYEMEELNCLKEEVARLRRLNGETNQKYVIAQDAYERCREGRNRRI